MFARLIARRTTTTTLRCVVSLLTLFLLASCSREETYATPEGDVKVKRSGSDIEVTSEDEEGNKFAAQSGKNVEIPTDFPSDVPIYSGAKPLVAMQMEAQGQSLTLESVDSLDNVYQFYVDALQANGWTLDAQMDLGGQKMIAAKKGNQSAVVSIGTSEGKTQIVLTVAEEQ